MRKSLSVLLLLALLLGLLSGCGAMPSGGDLGIRLQELSRGLTEPERSEPEESREQEIQDGDMIPFPQIPYLRPDLNVLRADVAAVRLSLAAGENYRVLSDLLDQCYADYFDFNTMYTLADIRACQDMTDAYYAGEFAWCDENASTVNQLMEELYYACGSSDMAQTLEERYFWEGFAQEYGDDGEITYDEELVSLLRQESSLLARYHAMVSSPTIRLPDGTEADYNSYLAQADEDEYMDAMLLYYDSYNEPLSQLYIELVKVRRAMAEKLDFDSYEQMQYAYFFERDYGPEEAAAYVADIKRWMVPFYEEVMGRDPYAAVSYDLLSSRRLHSILRTGAENIGGQVLEAFDFMSDYELYDIEVSADKAAMSFQTYLDSYEAPFLFLDPVGDVEDVETYAHEFGHYVDAFVNYNASETIDVSETFSQAMEYLILGYLDGAVKDRELENLYRIKMLDTLELYVQQASFAEFEQIVYSMDPEELTADFLNELSLRLAVDYGYYDGYSRQYYAMSWMDITHFFESPFYVITYPVSNDIAMQIYELEQQEKGAGLDKYLEILPRDYEGFLATVEAGGLESPFAPGRIRKVVEDLRGHLSW